MTEPDPAEPALDQVPPLRGPLRTASRIVLSVVLILWTLLDLLFGTLFRPLLRALGRLRLFETIGAALGRLPPYVALLALAVPFVIIEPFKVFSLYWFGLGHLVQGGILFVGAHLASFLIVERAYHAMHTPLMQIRWFKQVMTWLEALRNLGLDWAKSTPIWKAAAQWSLGLRATLRR